MPPREIRLHDTRTGALVPLQPRDPGCVGVYACGPTVYSRIHIGNARPFVVFSLLKRFLEHEGLKTTLVVNVTDVNDKIYAAAAAAAAAAAEAGAAATGAARPDHDDSTAATRPPSGSSAQLAADMTARYRADTDALGLGRPDHEPLASETMQAIVAYIETLIDTGHAYAGGGDVFFRVRSDPAYGSLSHRRLEDMDQGEGVEGSERKEDPLDFALWKAHKKADEDTSWDPRDFGAAADQPDWAPGRPGWHIECSAMAETLLGVGFDIHGGGSDLVFPHHENEAAQTRCARGAELARIWMHNGMIQLTGAKMAKSAGNIALLHEVLDSCDAADPAHAGHIVVMYLIGGHYRQPLAFSDDELHDADRRVHRVREALRRLEAGQASPADMAHHKETFFAALAADFNTPRALAALFEWVREANRREGQSVGDGDLREMLGVLGMGDMQPLAAVGDVRGIDPGAAELLAAREQARRERDFARADDLREQIRARGWEIRDGADGAELVPLAR